MQQKEIVRLVAVALVVLIVGYAAGYLPEKQKNDDLRAKVSKILPGIPEMREFGATIKEIRGKTIIVTVPPSASSLDEYPLEREVTITDATKIILRTPLDPMGFQKVLNEYMSSHPSPTSTPPTPFSETKLSISDLKVGDSVTIKTADDVKSARVFEAMAIIEAGAPPAPALPNLPTLPRR